MTKIIVLTPIKNEDWILNQFLTITSLFADCIIIADQLSTDSSRIICSKFPKVHLIENNNEQFCEDDRQILLIETARKLFPNDKRILFGLDADELFSADSLLYKETWDKIKSLEPGTSLYLEKSDILSCQRKCIRSHTHNLYFPLGYIDDGIAHSPDPIHSRRIPNNPAGSDVYIDDIKIMHFLYSRMKVRYSKIRYYAVIENTKKSSSFHIRRFAYNFKDVKGVHDPFRTEKIPKIWLKKWEFMKIKLTNFHEPEFSWQDFKVVEYFKNYGYRRFYVDNIWDFNWEACIKKAQEIGIETPALPIKRPSKVILSTLKIIDHLYLLSRRLRFK